MIHLGENSIPNFLMLHPRHQSWDTIAPCFLMLKRISVHYIYMAELQNNVALHPP
jgi:hypothetical protein